MALIKCNECDSEVSDKALSCPKCGCPIANTSSPSSPVPRISSSATASDAPHDNVQPTTMSGDLRSQFHETLDNHILAGAIRKLGFGIVIAFLCSTSRNPALIVVAWSVYAVLAFSTWGSIRLERRRLNALPDDVLAHEHDKLQKTRRDGSMRRLILSGIFSVLFISLAASNPDESKFNQFLHADGKYLQSIKRLNFFCFSIYESETPISSRHRAFIGVFNNFYSID